MSPIVSTSLLQRRGKGTYRVRNVSTVHSISDASDYEVYNRADPIRDMDSFDGGLRSGHIMDQVGD